MKHTPKASFSGSGHFPRASMQPQECRSISCQPTGSHPLCSPCLHQLSSSLKPRDPSWGLTCSTSFTGWPAGRGQEPGPVAGHLMVARSQHRDGSPGRHDAAGVSPLGEMPALDPHVPPYAVGAQSPPLPPTPDIGPFKSSVSHLSFVQHIYLLSPTPRPCGELPTWLGWAPGCWVGRRPVLPGQLSPRAGRLAGQLAGRAQLRQQGEAGVQCRCAASGFRLPAHLGVACLWR